MTTKTDLLKVIVQNPMNLLRALRLGVRAMLDDDFDARSPLGWMPAEEEKRMFSQAVTLPPLNRMEEGNQSIEGLVALIGIARMINAKTIFEIGTYNGITAYTLALNLPNAHVHTLDLPPGATPALPLAFYDDIHILNRSPRAYERTEQANRITQHFGDSAEFDFELFSHTCDLVYIDGAHSYHYVVSDTRQAMQMLAPGGAIVWDDYWRYVPDVPRHLHSLRADSLYRVPRTRLVVRFPKNLPL